MRPRLDASHERMFGEKNSLFGVTAHLDKRRTESFFLQTFFHRSEEHTSELQSRSDIVCRLLLEKKNNEELTSARTAARYTRLSFPLCYSELPTGGHGSRPIRDTATRIVTGVGCTRALHHSTRAP